MIVLSFFIMLALYVLLIWKADRVFPVLYLFAFLYCGLYLYFPYLTYYVYTDTLGIQMELEPVLYFQYVVPALLALFAGVFVINRDVDLREALTKINPVSARRYGYMLLVVSCTFDVVHYAGVSGIESIISFTSYLKYLGAFCFLFSKSKLHYALAAMVYAWLAVWAIQSSVFMDFLIWSVFLFFMAVLAFKPPFWLRLLLPLVALPIVFFIQSVKNEYRDAVWYGNEKPGVSTFFHLLTKQLGVSDEPLMKSKGVVRTVGRLTAPGYHLGCALKHVPDSVPHAHGKELLEDIKASFIPRIFFPDKKQVGSQQKHYRYTGYRVPRSLTMTIGIVGDFYINFGIIGSWIGLFILGALIAKLLHLFVLKVVLPDPIQVVWIPFLLMYLPRGNEFYMFFNALVKGLFIFLCFQLVWWYFYKRHTPATGNAMPEDRKKKRILIFYSHFAPAFKSGGPVQSLVNLVHCLPTKDVEIGVVCSAYEAGENVILHGVNANQWNAYLPGVRVYYVSGFVYGKILRTFRSFQPDVVYINGLFVPAWSVFPLLIAKLTGIHAVLAPRGMLQKSALAIKPLKKKFFLRAFQLSGLSKSVRWQATDDQECQDIRFQFGIQRDIHLVPNVPRVPCVDRPLRQPVEKPLRLIFLALISKMKNLHLILEALKQCDKPVIFHIYGPVKDKNYWEYCRSLLPSSVHTIVYKGAIEPSLVPDILSKYHAFILPTNGENFGHAIYEAMSVGTPVIISPNTPWGNPENNNTGILTMTDVASVAIATQKMQNCSSAEYEAMSLGAWETARDYFYHHNYNELYLKLFYEARND